MTIQPAPCPLVPLRTTFATTPFPSRTRIGRADQLPQIRMHDERFLDRSIDLFP